MAKELLEKRVEEPRVVLSIKVKETTLAAIDAYAKSVDRQRYEVIDALVERSLPSATNGNGNSRTARQKKSEYVP